MPTARLLNPHTFDSDRLDPESRRQLQALIAWFEERGKTVDYLVGTMIELPRAALRAGDIAETDDAQGPNGLARSVVDHEPSPLCVRHLPLPPVGRGQRGRIPRPEDAT